MDAILETLKRFGFSGNRLEAIGLVNEMRNWVLDCSWSESPDEILEMTDMEIVLGVNKRYEGGLEEFIACA